MKKVLFVCLMFSVRIVSAQTIVGKSQVGSLQPTTTLHTDSLRSVNISGTNQVNAYTPFLTAAVAFIDSTGNNTLSADGNAEVLVTLKNIGGKPARDCRIELVPSVKNLDLYIADPPAIDAILPNQQVNERIFLKASHYISTGRVEFTLKVLEKNGFICG